jgi:hypothetical protein
MPLDNIIRVERLQDVKLSAHGQPTRGVQLAIRVLKESTFDVDLFPRLLVFWEPKDGVRAHELLENDMVNREISSKQMALVDAGN